MSGEIYVPRIMPVLYGPAADTSAVGSSSRLVRPLADGLNHLAGYCLRGPICAMHNRQPAASTGETGRIYTYRHPNCDHLLLWAVVGASAQSTAAVSLKAGSGTATSAEAYFPDLATGTAQIQIVAPWGGADSGYQEVVITGTQVGFYDVAIWELYRTTLDSGEIGSEYIDTTHPRAGLGAGQYLIQSASAGVSGLITETGEAWDHQIRQLVGWWGTDVSVANGLGWTDPFGGAVFRHQARQKKAETTRDYRIYAYTRIDAGVTGEIRVTSGTETQTSGSLIHTTDAWTGTPLAQPLAVYTTTGDAITFEMQVTAGTGSIYCSALSILEDS